MTTEMSGIKGRLMVGARLGVVGVVLAAGVWVAVGQSAVSGNASAAYVAAPLRTAAINLRLRRAFKIFRHRPAGRSAHAADSLSGFFDSMIPDILGRWDGNGGAAAILGPANSQNAEVLTTTSGVQIMVLAGANGVCLAAPVQDGYTATCSAANTASTHGLGLQMNSTQGNGDSEMVGIVPDGNTSVMITLASGQQVSVPVTSNAYSIEASSLPVKATFKIPNGGSAFQEGEH